MQWVSTVKTDSQSQVPLALSGKRVCTYVFEKNKINFVGKVNDHPLEGNVQHPYGLVGT